jgi:hypothetical protein
MMKNVSTFALTPGIFLQPINHCMYGRVYLAQEYLNYYSTESSVAKECWEKPVVSFKLLNKFENFVFLLLFIVVICG